MGSKVVVTYKRKRLFSRSDHSHINWQPDRPSVSGILESNTSADLIKHEGPVEESILQNKDGECGICHKYFKDKAGENMLQGENCESHCCSQCSEKDATKLKSLSSACTEEKDSSVSNQNQKVTPDQIRLSPKSDVEQNSFNPNILLEGGPGETCQVDSTDQPNAEVQCDTQSKLSSVKSGSEDGDKCEETSSISRAPDACSSKEPHPMNLQTSDGINFSNQMKDASLAEIFTLEETDKLNKDDFGSLCNNLGTKRKLNSTLITFCRRSKRNKDTATPHIASESERPPAASCSVDLENEKVKSTNSFIVDEGKKCPEDIDSSSASASAPAPATAMVIHMDDPLHSPQGEAKNAPTAIAQNFQDSQGEMSLQGKACMNVQDNHHIDERSKGLSDEDPNSGRTPSDVSGKWDSQLSLDLSTSPHASRDIDCNRPLDRGFDENHPLEPLKVRHDPLGSSSEIKENVPTLPVQGVENGSPVRAVSNKGKSIVDFQPVLTGTSSKYNYIQLFPENQSNDMLQLANDGGNASQFMPSSLQSSNSRGLSLQPEQMFEGRACSSSLHEWPYVQVQPRESFQEFLLSSSEQAQSFSRHKMMLDNILSRARAVRGNGTWSEEELDCLWIGVRRHGRGNWDGILRDRRLQFLPWRTPQDLAERWQEEQAQLFCNMPVSQLKYATSPDFSSNHVTGLQQPRARRPLDEVQVQLSLGDVQKQPSLHYMNGKKNRQLQRPVTNSSTLPSCSHMTNGCWGLYNPSDSNAILGDESSSNAGLRKGTLPHWLRAAVEIPARPFDPTQTALSSVCHSGMGWLSQPSFDSAGNSQQPWLDNRYTPAQRRTEPHKGGKAACSTSVIRRGKTLAGKQDDLIIIPSDASSEETISDDHSIRP